MGAKLAESEFEKMRSGLLYDCMVPDLIARRARAKLLAREYNEKVGYSSDQKKRDEFLEKVLGKVGLDCIIEPPFRCDYGENIFVGDNFYSNFDLVVLDWYVCMVRRD